MNDLSINITGLAPAAARTLKAGCYSPGIYEGVFIGSDDESTWIVIT